MTKKLLFRHTSTLLRTALLLGAMILVNTQAQAQAQLPDAFETVDPSNALRNEGDEGDNDYFYIQFYEGMIRSYLADRGATNILRSKDFIPFANNIQWKLERTGTEGQFYLKCRTGNYAYLDAGNYKSTDNKGTASVFTSYKRADGGYELSTVADQANGMYRDHNYDWANIQNYTRNNQHNCLRIAKLKTNSAFIIYYRDKAVYDTDNTDRSNWDQRFDEIGVNHYLTYSNTDDPSAISNGLFTTTMQNVSSRTSILGKSKQTWTLATAAAYHQDGLWTIEKNGDNIKIKKYGTNDYLTRTLNVPRKDNGTINLYHLETGNSSTFTLTDPTANRYTPIKNIYGNYFNYADGDGWYLMDWDNASATNTWKAGFLPVEVVQEDKFYQVILKIGDQMVGVSDGNAVLKPYSEFNPDLWTLEQFGDYQHYRLKTGDGKYYTTLNGTLSNTAPTEGNGVFSNTELNIIFTSIQWIPKTETRIPHDIIHKVSNVKLYYQYNPTTPEKQKVYQQQGLVTDDLTDWQNADGTQKVNEFKITHYVKKGEPIEFGLPTTLGANNDHRFYQRWYHYNDETCDTAYPDGSDIEGLKNHLKLKTSAGEVMGYLYNNGLVTGEELDWPVVFPGAKKYESHLFTYNNSDGNSFTLAADVSRYNDFNYQNESSHLDGKLQEPSLTMRYIFYMRDAKEMANKLMACTGDKWLEEKTIHFPAKRLKYEDSKKDAYKGEFVGLKHIFRDYWVFNGDASDDNLVSAVINNTSGNLRFVVEPGSTGITEGGKDNKCYYLYDEGKPAASSYGDSRFVAFKYPGEQVNAAGEENPAYLKVYFDYGGNSYQVAKFTLIFDKDTSTLPWTSVNGSDKVQGSDRDPNELAKTADLIAKITFDYPKGATYKTASEKTAHNNGIINGWWTEIQNSSPLPLTFDNTNYGFDGENPSWGSYAMVSTMPTRWGNNKTALPVDHETYGYNIAPDDGMQSAFLYIDASEQPGDICQIPFTGEFCSGDKLMCTGWISGSNKVINDNRCPGSVTITVKGSRKEGGETVTDDIYRFCPGQCYELDNGTGVDGNVGATHVVWQQFYFEFKINRKYERQWVEVNNNCVSSTGGDFMLDNIEVYAMVPEVDPELNTPLCVNKEASEMQLLKLDIEFDPLIVASGVNTGAVEGDNNFGLVFLEKDVFLKTLKDGLKTYNHIDISLAQVEENVNAGVYKDITGTYKQAYEAAFDAALLGKHDAIWDSKVPNANAGRGVLNYHWNHHFEKNESYTFIKAVNRLAPVFGYENSDGKKYIILNGNFPKLPWKVNTDYYIIYYNDGITDISMRYQDFNICSDCNKAKVFRLNPPFKIISLESSDETYEAEVCEGRIPTVLTDLMGYDTAGHSVQLTDINFDWWLGNLNASPKVVATIEKYHSQVSSKGVRLDEALSTLRAYYPGITTLDGIVKHLSETPNLTENMIEYLQELVDNGELILHQKSINIPAKKVSEDDPYCYFVACPIHDGDFETALNAKYPEAVAYFCDEPQGLALKIGEKAPSLKCGFVSDENGFPSYAYPADSDPVLSIRLAKKAQFETVQHGEKSEEPKSWDANTNLNYLWLPIRNASTTIKMSDDYNVYLASTDDPVGDKAIYTEVKTTGGSLPIVGKIVKLQARESTPNGYNRLCIYFTDNFEVREGYTYTLSLPFRDAADANSCDGTLLLNLKIVPDYEVWTGAADNTDWNNDQNWRRADGNLSTPTTESTDGSARNNNELLISSDLPNTSPLYGYTTNYANYRTAIDRILRKGFAPLYCTHVLMKNNEWGNAPVLYDALDNQTSLSAAPFPNLRDNTSTPILKFDMQARLYDIWEDTYGSAPDKGRTGDLIAEMYQINSCDEIAFQPGAELLNAHLLNYNNAWVEYELNNNRWYLLGSPLQGTISGEWYAPSGTAQQKTTYYENVTFGPGYDRYSPAVFQRSWDKAKAVLYEVGSTYSTADNPDDLVDNGSAQQGAWTDNNAWNVNGADRYLDRLGYKPMVGKKANVAIKGVWSNTYNDATVDYTQGAFSVLVNNGLKGFDQSEGKAIIRLPKEDTMYDYYKFSEKGVDDGGTDTDLSAVQSNLNRAKNRGRLKTDLLLPASTRKTEASASRYGDQRTYTRVPTTETALKAMTVDNFTETVSAGASNLGYYLVENPFTCGLDMERFFAANTGLEKKYWLLTTAESGQSPRQQLVQQAPNGEWVTADGNNFVAAKAKVAPGQGFFVQATTAGPVASVTFNKEMQAQTRYGAKTGARTFKVVVGTKQKMTTKTETITMDDGTTKTVTIEVPVTDNSGNYVVEDITDDVKVSTYVQSTGDGKDFPLKARTRSADDADDLGMVITAERGEQQSSALVMQREGASNDFLPEEDTETFINSDLENVPTVYTLCGRLATTINSIHDFRSLPVGVESNSSSPCTLTFQGVELLGDSVAFYDALEQKLMPLESGMKVTVSGQTQNRYYIVRSLNQKEVAEETHLQIFTEGLTAKVIASTAEPITDVRCFDTAGRLIHSASPQSTEYSFTLPISGVYIIEAETENDRKTKKLMAR